MSSILKGRDVKKDQKSNMITPQGTKYWLDDTDWTQFILGHVYECSQNQNNFYLIEQKSEVFNMFFDFDFKEMNDEGKQIEPKLITFIQGKINETIYEFFDCMSDMYTSKNLDSNNLHFNLPDIHVTNETAMNVRAKLVEKLFCEIPGEWHDIVDAAVLKSSGTGLRILGCPKMKKGTTEKLDGGYRIIEIQSEEINTLDITMEHITKTLIRYNGKETPAKHVEIFRIDVPKIVNESELESICSHITHPYKFSKKINNFTFIFFNEGPRQCMVREGYTHQNNHFYVKKTMSNEYYYHCHHEDCKSIGPKFLFQTIVEGDFEKKKMIAISKENAGKEKWEVHSEFLSYMNNYFSYILKQDCFMESRDGQLFWYKVLANRLNFSVPCDIMGLDKKGIMKVEEQMLDPHEIFKRSAFRREYNNVVFEPYLTEKIDTKKDYNLFTGFKHEYKPDFSVDRTKIEPILHHLKTVWCKENEEVFEYLLSWYADMIQNPGTLPGIAVVVYGKPGAGKGSICNFLGNKVIGQKYYSSVSEIRQLLGNFNSKIMNKILICCDEVANFGGAIANNNKLKGLITEPFQSIEMKFKEPMDVKSCSRYVFLTNNEWPVKVECNDRRFLCLETDSRYIGDSKYFKELTDCFTDDVAEHMFHFLAEYKISWNKHKIPMTSYRRDLMKRSLPTSIQYILHLIDVEGRIVPGESDTQKILIHELYDNYGSWFPSVLKTDHQKVTLGNFVESICTIFDVRLVTEPTDDWSSYGHGSFKFDGMVGNSFLFTKQDEYNQKVASAYGYHESI